MYSRIRSRQRGSQRMEMRIGRGRVRLFFSVGFAIDEFVGSGRFEFSHGIRSAFGRHVASASNYGYNGYAGSRPLVIIRARMYLHCRRCLEVARSLRSLAGCTLRPSSVTPFLFFLRHVTSRHTRHGSIL